MQGLKLFVKKYLPLRVLQAWRMLKIGHLEGVQWHILHWKAPVTYCQDGLLSVHATGFNSDSKFLTAYEKGQATLSWGGGESKVHWRAYIACWAGMHALRLGEGDFVEAGANRGGTALTMIEYLGRQALLNRKFFLLDTFSGIDSSLLSPKELERFKMFGQSYTECYEDVKKTFLPYDFVKLIRGSVPGTLSQVNSGRVIFLHIDMNAAQPEVATIEHFWDRMPLGAIILLDDYGWDGAEEQKKSLDKFAQSKSVKILALPTGQGLLIRS